MSNDRFVLSENELYSDIIVIYGVENVTSA